MQPACNSSACLLTLCLFSTHTHTQTQPTAANCSPNTQQPTAASPTEPTAASRCNRTQASCQQPAPSAASSTAANQQQSRSSSLPLLLCPASPFPAPFCCLCQLHTAAGQPLRHSSVNTLPRHPLLCPVSAGTSPLQAKTQRLPSLHRCDSKTHHQQTHTQRTEKHTAVNTTSCTSTRAQLLLPSAAHRTLAS